MPEFLRFAIKVVTTEISKDVLDFTLDTVKNGGSIQKTHFYTKFPVLNFKYTFTSNFNSSLLSDLNYHSSQKPSRTPVYKYTT